MNNRFSTIFTLPEGEGVHAIAEGCRTALLSFLNGVWLEGWTKQDLVAWLRGPYETVTRVAAEVAHARSLPLTASTASVPELDEHAVERLLAQTHRESVNVLRAMADPEQGTSLVFTCVRSGLVVRCEDHHGREGWLPTATGRMRFGERIQSLIAVDFLTRPQDYEALLTVCGQCRAVEFDALSRARGLCRVDAGVGSRVRPGSDIEALQDSEATGSGADRALGV